METTSIAKWTGLYTFWTLVNKLKKSCIPVIGSQWLEAQSLEMVQTVFELQSIWIESAKWYNMKVITSFLPYCYGNSWSQKCCTDDSRSNSSTRKDSQSSSMLFGRILQSGQYSTLSHKTLYIFIEHSFLLKGICIDHLQLHHWLCLGGSLLEQKSLQMLRN